MGKKDKQKQKGKQLGTARDIPNKENNSRLTYLYHLSNLFTTTTQNGSHLTQLARGYTRSMDLIAKKTVSKVSPEVKRTICKKCHTLLIPGLTMSMYIENLTKGAQNEKGDVFVNKCLLCGKCKRFPVGKDRNYVPFHQRNAVKETVEEGDSQKNQNKLIGE